MSPSDDSAYHDMQSFTPARLDSHLKGLFEVPSKNIESAFELVLGLITQQSFEINELKKSYRESLERNDELKCQIEGFDSQLVKEKVDFAVKYQKLKKHHDHLLAIHEETLSTVGYMQHEITNLSFHIHGISDEHQESNVDRVDHDSIVLVHKESSLNPSLEHGPVSEDYLPQARHSLKGMPVAADSYSLSSSSAYSQSKEVVIDNGGFSEHTCSESIDDSSLHSTRDHPEHESDPIVTDVEDVNTPSILKYSVDVQSNQIVDSSLTTERHDNDGSKRHSTKSNDSIENTTVSKEMDYCQTIPCMESSHVFEDPELIQESIFYNETGPKQSVSPRGSEAKNRFFGIVRAKKLASDKTIAARLNRLEHSLSKLMSYLPLNIDNQQDTGRQPTDEMVSSISMRVVAIEHFLQGFDRIDRNALTSAIVKCSSKDICIHRGNAALADDVEYQLPNSFGVEGHLEDEKDSEVTNESSVTRDWSVVQSDGTTNAFVKNHSLLSHLKERENRTDSTIEDLARQIADLKHDIRSQETGSPTANASVSNLAEDFHRQLSDLEVTLQSKVSNEDFIRETESIREFLKDFTTSQGETSFGKDYKLSQLFKQIDELAESKLNKDEFKQLLAQTDATLRHLVEGEVSKQQLYISRNSEKFTNDLTEFRSMIDSRIDSIAHPRDGCVSPPNTEDALIQSGSLDEIIQQATDAVRDSLEESFTKKIGELKFLEDELDGLVSQLAEKPSQDQIHSMLHNLEAKMSERIGQDVDFQLLVENMKRDLSQRMTRGEVLKLIKSVFKDAKQEIQNTKDTLMIGRIPYKCIGCNQTFPEGVNGTRAPKVNHDSLPPSQGLSIPPILHPANNKSLRPLQTRRSVQFRPNTAVIGGSFVSKYSFQERNSSR